MIRQVLSSLGYKISRIQEPKPNVLVHEPAWNYQRKMIEPNIKSGDLILEIGSGHNPLPVSNILTDYFPDETEHRASKLIEDRPVVICSAERLPFLSKSIDFVICSHVFEHLQSPERGGLELARVGKAGYLETPAYNKDILVGSGYIHDWQVVEFEGEMHFYEYSKRQKEAHVFSPVMQLWVQNEHHPWQEFFWERQDLFNACLLWKDAPKIKEFRRPNSQKPELKAWKSVNMDKISNEAPNLTEHEIQLLEKCLASADGTLAMKYKDGFFADESTQFVYPVRGKRIYCESASV